MIVRLDPNFHGIRGRRRFDRDSDFGAGHRQQLLRDMSPYPQYDRSVIRAHLQEFSQLQKVYRRTVRACSRLSGAHQGGRSVAAQERGGIRGRRPDKDGNGGDPAGQNAAWPVVASLMP